MGAAIFVAVPIILAAWLGWRYPCYRRVRLRSIAIYLAVMTVLLWGTLRFVAYVATAIVPWREVAVVLWFTIACRLAWEVWNRSAGRLGQRFVRWGRARRRRGLRVPLAV